MAWLLENWSTLVQIVSGLMLVASLIVGLTPTPKDDAVLKSVREFLIRISFLKPSNEPGTVKLPGARQ